MNNSGIYHPSKLEGQDTANITILQQISCSCTGALITSTIVTPLDVVKTRLQAQHKEFFKKKCFLYCNGLMDHVCVCHNNNNNSSKSTKSWYNRPGHFNGTLDAFIKIVRYEGASSLWSGLPPTLVMAVPATIIYFTVYDRLREFLIFHLQAPEQPHWVPTTSGAIARMVVVTAISPLELVRTKMQSQKLGYWEIAQAVKDLLHHQGYFSLWKGWGPTMLRDVPFSALYWTNYEAFKHLFNQQKWPSFWFSFVAGAASGSIAAVLTLPFDVIKTRRQIELGEIAVHHEKPQTTSTFALLKRALYKEGIGALFTGLVPRLIKVAPACAIMISTYEYGKSFFYNYNKRKLEEVKKTS